MADTGVAVVFSCVPTSRSPLHFPLGRTKITSAVDRMQAHVLAQICPRFLGQLPGIYRAGIEPKPAMSLRGLCKNIFRLGKNGRLFQCAKVSRRSSRRLLPGRAGPPLDEAPARWLKYVARAFYCVPGSVRLRQCCEKRALLIRCRPCAAPTCHGAPPSSSSLSSSSFRRTGSRRICWCAAALCKLLLQHSWTTLRAGRRLQMCTT